MNYSINESLKVIIDEIKITCTREELVNRFQLKKLLETTNATERYLIAKTFCQTTWNIGSLSVLGLLQELRILTATELILSIEDNNDLQLILNDFLEAEFQLLANLFISANYDDNNKIKLNAILNDCLENLFNDLLKNPNVNDLNYLRILKNELPDNICRKLAIRHIDVILGLHKSNIKTAFANFSDWINEGVDVHNFPKILHQSLIYNNEEDFLHHLFKISVKEKFNDWKFYLIFLQTIASNCQPNTIAFIKKYLKTRLKEIVIVPSKESMLHLLLTVRAATATTVDVQRNINNYAEWYRQNIAEMKLVFKAEEFQIIAGLLEQCIPYEMEEIYLDIHVSISIAPPVLCGKIVQVYKSNCKLRLSQIKNQNDDDDSIAIDSD